MPLISKKQKTRVGLDVGSYAVKVVEMKDTPTGSEIVKVGLKKLLPGAIVDGEPMDRDAVISAIREIYEEYDIANKETSSAICGRSVIIKKIKMEEMDDDTAREVMTLEAEQYVPFEKEELSVDFEILRRGMAGNTMEVLLVAAKRESMVEAREDMTTINTRMAPPVPRSFAATIGNTMFTWGIVKFWARATRAIEAVTRGTVIQANPLTMKEGPSAFGRMEKALCHQTLL